MTTTVMIVDDQRATRLGLALMIGKADDLRVIAQAENGRDALDQLAEIERRRTPRPNVVLMDVRMPVLNGIDATAAITRKHPGVKVLVLTTYDQDDYAFGALGAGASGFLLRTPGPPTCTKHSERSPRATRSSPRASPGNCSNGTCRAPPPRGSARRRNASGR